MLYRTNEAPGTIIVQTAERHLYLIQGNGRALRYGIGVGREGFQWQGLVNITRKAEWPDWTPPPEMIARQPYLPRFMAGGPGNPLGARAMYLGTTVYRIHGTNRPDTSARRCLPAVSGWSTPTLPTFTSASRSAPRSSSGRSQNCNRDARRLFSRSAVSFRRTMELRQADRRPRRRWSWPVLPLHIDTLAGDRAAFLVADRRSSDRYRRGGRRRPSRRHWFRRGDCSGDRGNRPAHRNRRGAGHVTVPVQRFMTATRACMTRLRPIARFRRAVPSNP